MKCIHKPGVTVIPLRLCNLMGAHLLLGILPCWLELLLILACSCSLQGDGLPTFLLPYDSCTNDTACSLLVVFCGLGLIIFQASSLFSFLFCLTPSSSPTIYFCSYDQDCCDLQAHIFHLQEEGR